MKNLMIVFVALLGLNLISSWAQASIDVYEFSSENTREKYHAVIKELRCPKCQNQDIADSNAPIAKDMRREVHRMVEEGNEPDTIVNYMVERFGEFVSYRPKVNRATYLLWFGPFALVMAGLIVVVVIARKRVAVQAAKSKTHLAVEEEARLNALLTDDGADIEQGSNDRKDS